MVRLFSFSFHYQPSVGHATVWATPDCVHRVTVLCALPCATLLMLCHIVLSCCATLLYSVYSVYHAVPSMCCVPCAVSV